MENHVLVRDLKPGMRGITLRVRVLEASSPETVETRRGKRTLSRALVGDETGRVQVTLWGRAAGRLKPGEAVELRDAWVTSYRGQLVVNVGGADTIARIEDDEVPKASEIPQAMPRAPGRRLLKGTWKPSQRRRFRSG